MSGFAAASARKPQASRPARSRCSSSCCCSSLWSPAALPASAAPRRSTRRCDLDKLRPVAIGQNSFVYAADGSLLGTIPAEQNRQPVALEHDQPVAAEGDARDRGPPLLPARRRRLRGHRPGRVGGRPGGPRRPGRLDDHPAARPQPLHRQRSDARAQGQGGLPRDQAQPALVEGPDPRGVPEPGLLRQPRLRRRGRRADVLLAARARTSRSGRRRCSPGCRRRRRSTTRSTGRTARSRAATPCCARCSRTATSPARSTGRRSPSGGLELKRGPALHSGSASRTSSATCARSSSREYGARHRSLGRAARLHDDRPALPAAGREGDHATRSTTAATPPRRSSRSTRRRVHPGDDRRDPGPQGATSSTSPRRHAARPGSTFKTFVLADGDRAGHRPRLDVLHLGAVLLPARTRTAAATRSWWCVETYGDRYYGSILGPTRRRSAPTTRSTRS